MRFLNIFNEPGMYLLYLLAIFGIIAAIVFLCRKYIPALNSHNEIKPDATSIAKEELDRLLVPVEDLKEKKEESVDEEGTTKE